MQFKKIISVMAISSFLFTSCATIVSNSNWPLTINSTPSGARVEITNDNDEIVYTGLTPCILELKSGDGYFCKANYKLKLSKNGYNEKLINIGTRFNGLYIGNIIFGGVIGLLIVDPLTGAMYKLDTKEVDETLTKKE